MSYDDLKYRAQEARELSSMRAARAPKLTEERQKQIADEMNQLWENFTEQSPEERIQRLNRMFELGRERGYVYSLFEPGIDIARMNDMRRWISEAEAEIAARDAAPQG
jgi:hypothetical protein